MIQVVNCIVPALKMNLKVSHLIGALLICSLLLASVLANASTGSDGFSGAQQQGPKPENSLQHSLRSMLKNGRDVVQNKEAQVNRYKRQAATRDELHQVGPPSDPNELHQEITETQSRLRRLMNMIMNSSLMPSQDMMIQLIASLLTLVLMMFLGPLAGANAAYVQSFVKYALPYLISAVFNYTSSNEAAVSAVAKIPNHPITSVQVQPVEAVQSGWSKFL